MGTRLSRLCGIARNAASAPAPLDSGTSQRSCGGPSKSGHVLYPFLGTKRARKLATSVAQTAGSGDRRAGGFGRWRRAAVGQPVAGSVGSDGRVKQPVQAQGFGELLLEGLIASQELENALHSRRGKRVIQILFDELDLFNQGLAAMEKIYTQGKDGKFGYLEVMYRF